MEIKRKKRLLLKGLLSFAFICLCLFTLHQINAVNLRFKITTGTKYNGTVEEPSLKFRMYTTAYKKTKEKYENAKKNGLLDASGFYVVNEPIWDPNESLDIAYSYDSYEIRFDYENTINTNYKTKSTLKKDIFCYYDTSNEIITVKDELDVESFRGQPVYVNIGGPEDHQGVNDAPPGSSGTPVSFPNCFYSTRNATNIKYKVTPGGMVVFDYELNSKQDIENLRNKIIEENKIR